MYILKTILVTGGAGFIGSNFIYHMLKKYDDIHLVNLDALTYAGNLRNLDLVANDPRYTFIKGDIRNSSLVNTLFAEYKFDTVVNFAAESHVDRSIIEPEIFLTTNIIGTQILLIHNCTLDRNLPVYGDGMQIRDWLYVEDHCSAIDTVLRKGMIGEVYNIGGNNEKTNIEIVELIISRMGKDRALITHVKDRPGHDRRYAIDNTKITTELGWTPSYTFDVGIEQTINWYLCNKEWMESVTTGDYLKYYDTMYS